MFFSSDITVYGIPEVMVSTDSDPSYTCYHAMHAIQPILMENASKENMTKQYIMQLSPQTY